MKNNNSIAYNVILVLGDFVALAAAFVVSYILRVSVSHVPLSEHVTAATYINLVLSILPFWIVIFAILGLYNARHYDNRFSEFGRLLVGCLIGVMGAISYAYIANIQIFPARLVVLYAVLLAFLFVVLFRTVIRGFRRMFFARGRGLNRVLVVGDSKLTPRLVAAISASQRTQGDFVIGVVGGAKHVIEPNTGFMVFSTFDDAVSVFSKHLPNTIIQTELYGRNEQNNDVLAFAQQHHIDYRFVPGSSELYVGNIEVELFHSIPMVAVHQTALVGWGRVVKRGFDIVFSLLAIIVSSPIMLVVALLIKLSDGGPVFLRQARLTRANRVFQVFKFRSHNRTYNGLSPEEAFQKMGKPELIAQYRANGDKLENDPRVTRIGHFIRTTSIDELPQLFNVLRGDISMVGPRALVPEELAKYSRKHTILSVRSGLTGLAQVSGRRDISFDERRKLDIYYVQNWTFRGDLIILIRTVWIVLFHRGAE
jgi:exopolysaccharide biosynthesis polyprenyl glycosylphosphotransferase